MFSEQQNLRLQAEKHPMVSSSEFRSVEEFVLHLIHLRAYEEAGRIAAGKRTMDWGCNNGYGLEVMQRFGCAALCGVDISPAAIQAARQRLGADARLILCDGRNVPVRVSAFDLVTSFQVIEHIADCTQYLTEVARVLKPGGIAMFTTPNAAIRLDPGMAPWNEFHVREYGHEELAAQLGPYFSRVEIKGLFGVEDLQRTELARCDRARELTRNPPPAPAPSWRKAAREMLPEPVLSRMRALRAKRQTQPAALTLPPWSTADLFYRTDNLASALDLMAICTK